MAIDPFFFLSSQQNINIDLLLETPAIFYSLFD